MVDGSAPVLGSAVIKCKKSGIQSSQEANNWQCIIINEDSKTCKVYGNNMTLNTDLTIQESYNMNIPLENSLIIPKGVTLTNNGTISGTGTIDLRGGGLLAGSVVPEVGVTLKCKVNRKGSNKFNLEEESVAAISDNYSETLSDNAGYVLPDNISVKIAGKQIVVNQYDYDKNSNSATLTIPRALITGNIEIEVKAMYEIELTSGSETSSNKLDFGVVTYGSVPDEGEIKVTNIGEKAVNVGLPSSEKFHFAWTSESNENKTITLEPEKFASFSVKPNTKLNASTSYNDTIIVSTVSDSDRVSDSFTAEFTVTPKQLDSPEILTWSSSTPGKATVTWKSVNNASGYSVKLYKDDNAVDVNANVTVNESEYTGTFNIAGEGIYTVKVKAKGVGNYADSEVETSSPLQFYSVKFDTDNGKDLSPQVVVKNGKVLDPLTGGNVLTKNGYTFAGWYSDSNFAENSKWDFDNNTVQNDTTLYARWYLG